MRDCSGCSDGLIRPMTANALALAIQLGSAPDPPSYFGTCAPLIWMPWYPIADTHSRNQRERRRFEDP